MLPGFVEADFERWRTERDLEGLAAVFDAVAPELLRVARHLARDEASAEDLVQTTFLEVLRYPRRFRAGARVVPWLVGILTRQAGKDRRRAARTIDAGHLRQRREPVPEHHLAADELDDAVHAALQHLDEPYAAVVRAHLFEGVRPVELAARHACTPGAIRMQLSRGLAMLRRALPFGLAVPLAVTRAEAAARLRESALARAAALPVAATAFSLLGFFVMFKHCVALAGLVAVALISWLAFEATAPLSPSGTVAPPDAARAVLASDVPASVAGAARESAVEREAVADKDRPGVWLVGTVRFSRRAHMAPAIVEVTAWERGDRLRTEARDDGSYELDLAPLMGPRAATDADGSVGVSPTAEDRLLLNATASQDLCLPMIAIATVPLASANSRDALRCEVRQDFDLQPAAVLRGRIVVMRQDMLGQTKLGVFTAESMRASVPEPVATTQPDADGVFQLKIEEGGDVELWVFHPRCSAVLRPATAILGQRTDVGTIRLDATSVSLSGRVDVPIEMRDKVLVAAHRAAPAGGNVKVTRFEGLARDNAHLVSTRGEGCSDSTGAFVIDGLEAGPWRLRVDSVPSWPLVPPDDGLSVVAPAVELVLASDRVPMRLQVRGPHGPVAACVVTIFVEHAPVPIESNDDGCVQWLGLRDRGYRFTIDDARYEPATVELSGQELAAATGFFEVRARATASLDLIVTDEVDTRERHVLLRLLDSDGKELAPAVERQVVLTGEPLRFEALPAGRFVLRIEPQHPTGSLFPIAGSPTATVETSIELRAGETTSAQVVRRGVGRLRIDADLSPNDNSRARLEVLDATGKTIATRTTMDRPDGWLQSTGVLDCRGRNTISPDLAPGHYSVVVTHPLLGTLRRPIEVVAGEIATLRLER